MKKVLTLMAAVVIAAVALGQEFSSSLKNEWPLHVEAVFNWTATSFNFGKIKRNVPVTHEFTFLNSGNESLVISSVQASCGCTVTEYTKDPIPSGERGFVKATYNAANSGSFTKTVSIKANTGGEAVLLTITGEVID